MKRLWLCLVLALVVVGCAGPYQREAKHREKEFDRWVANHQFDEYQYEKCYRRYKRAIKNAEELAWGCVSTDYECRQMALVGVRDKEVFRKEYYYREVIKAVDKFEQCYKKAVISKN